MLYIILYCGYGLSGCSAVGSARALGAWGRGFKSLHPDIHWPLGQVVKTPPFHGGNRGSSPLGVTISGRLAQLGEHLPYKQGVGGSSPSSPTKKSKHKPAIQAGFLYVSSSFFHCPFCQFISFFIAFYQS